MTTSPYAGKSTEEWQTITRRLLEEHPLSTDEVVEVVLYAWNSIFESKMGKEGFQIGKDIFPKPQIMGFFLHELIPLEFKARYSGVWRTEESSSDKDIVYVPNTLYSIEIKTSSNTRHIYGNRSYAQKSTRGKKAKSGYYITVNFEKFKKKLEKPKIRIIRFGWLDSDDWIGQKAATGQQSRLSPEVENNKLLTFYSA